MKAMMSRIHGGIDGVRVACLDAVTTASPISEPAKIHHVSKLNNFEFTEGGIKAWRAYDIGRGKEVTHSLEVFVFVVCIWDCRLF